MVLDLWTAVCAYAPRAGGRREQGIQGSREEGAKEEGGGSEGGGRRG